MASKYVCDRCGVAVHLIRKTWKHSTNQHNLSCGGNPVVIERAVYDAEQDEIVRAAKKRGKL